MEIKAYLKGVKGLIFDYGGTIDTGGVHWSHIIWEAWQQAGVGCTLPLFREAYVYGERELARTRHILPEHDFNDLLRIKVEIELQWLAEQGEFAPADIKPYAQKIAGICNGKAAASIEAARPTLEALSNRFPMVMVSNFYGNLKTVLKTYGIQEYFKKVVESAVEGVRKPDPAIFEKGVEALGLQAPDVLAIGDSYRKDIEPALKAGCRAVWLKGTGWEAAEEQNDYEYTIKNLQELVKLFASPVN